MSIKSELKLRSRRCCIALVCIAANLFGALPSWAACIGVEPVDTPHLPRFCQFCVEREYKKSSSYKRWQQVLGSDVDLHLHHYCTAIATARQSRLAQNSVKKKALATTAINNFEYVLARWPKTFRLYPEALTRMGQTFATTGRSKDAGRYYLQAIQLQPRYVPAYAAYSDWRSSLGDKNSAKEILQQGLRNVPNSRPLLDRLNKIDER